MTPWIVFTALDGCLLDSRTRAFAEARPALDGLRQRKIPVIPCTLGTAAEALRDQGLLGISGPFAVEGGSGVYVPKGYVPRLQWDHTDRGEHDLIPFALDREILLEGFDGLKEALKGCIRGFRDMTADEVASDTGLPLPAARLALKREFDEPFKFVQREAEFSPMLPGISRELGLHVTRGNRYYHLHGNTDTGLAVEVLKSIFEMRQGPFRSLGIGESEADLMLLQAVDVAVAVQRPDGTHDPALIRGIRGLRCVPAPGPAGWSRAVLEILGSGAGIP
jgi:mannosyl-3-phosphoglycerate phosphatase